MQDEIDKNTDKKENIILYLKRFPFKKWAAESVGICRDTINDWEAKDPEFSARVKSAIAEGVASLGKKASPDMLLAAVDPETFGKKKEEEEKERKPLVIIKDGNQTIEVAN